MQVEDERSEQLQSKRPAAAEEAAMATNNERGATADNHVLWITRSKQRAAHVFLSQISEMILSQSNAETLVVQKLFI